MKRFERSLPAIGAAVAVAAGALAPGPTFAWGADGHRLIAEQAQQLLMPAARAEVAGLLALEPGSTMVSISTWADETRSPGTASWHYVNLPRDSDCANEAPRDCPGGACVVGAIERQQAVLASKALDADRLVALKYLVHFVGDVHQPLHAGYADDKGGNTYQVRFEGRGTNLHAVWDSGLIRTWPGGQDALRAAVSAKLTKDADASAPAQWAQESCRIVGASGFYPQGHVLGDEYSAQMDPVVVDRLAAAASRLAVVLNASLGAR
ncbi:MAG: S1/P1 nuclease [Pseudomonadota bacterium]|nr:S1/P1 nuclease [Pseudomonadota bacterium]